MKKIILLFTFVFAVIACFAQQGEIIYVENPSPGLLHPIVEPGYALYDIDGNGTQDIWIGVPNYPWYYVAAFTVGDMQYFTPGFGYDFMVQFINPGDTLSSMPNFWRNAPEDPWGDKTSKDSPLIMLDPGDDVDSVCIGLRRLVEGRYCYGWLRFSARIANDNTNVYIHDYAFCTDPNYPFRAGQTSIIWEVNEDNNTLDFATIHPNPTMGMVTVSGGDLQGIEVYAPLGQLVMRQLPRNDNVTFDLTGQPAGIYLIRITNHDGKRCVKKVVKQ